MLGTVVRRLVSNHLNLDPCGARRRWRGRKSALSNLLSVTENRWAAQEFTLKRLCCRLSCLTDRTRKSLATRNRQHFTPSQRWRVELTLQTLSGQKVRVPVSRITASFSGCFFCKLNYRKSCYAPQRLIKLIGSFYGQGLQTQQVSTVKLV